MTAAVDVTSVAWECGLAAAPSREVLVASVAAAWECGLAAALFREALEASAAPLGLDGRQADWTLLARG